VNFLLQMMLLWRSYNFIYRRLLGWSPVSLCRLRYVPLLLELADLPVSGPQLRVNQLL